jgi:outer membrane lipoprotein SlyB
VRRGRTADQEIISMKAITGVLGGALTLLTATSAMAQTAYDDATCRQWAAQNANYAQAQANNNAVGSTLGGALLGAGLGAAIGGGRGAAIGAASGAVVGTGAGAAQAQGAGNNAYWQAYNYCMSTRTPAPQPAYPPGYGQPQPYNPYYGR